MITLKDNQRYYDDLKINSTLHDDKKSFKYELNLSNLEGLIAVLNQARFEMRQPKAAHFTIFIDDDFDITTLMPRIKRVINNEKCSYFYTIEKANKLHVHLAVVLETEKFNPETVFYHKILPAIKKLKHVNGCDLNERWHYKKNETPKYYHSLKIPYEFRDAVERYSYFSKINDKEKVPDRFIKKFAKSKIHNNKYYSIAGANNMLKIKQIKSNQSLHFSDDNTINLRYLKIRKMPECKQEQREIFNINDMLTNKDVGFYGFTYAFESLHDLYVVSIEMDDLYISAKYADSDKDMNYFDVVYLHLRDQMNGILLKAKDEICVHQQLLVYTNAHFNPAVDELLSMVVASCAEELGIAINPVFDGFNLPCSPALEDESTSIS